jgi:Zn-finger nucleic acid-binding protein
VKCPNDQTTLVMSERSGVEIDYCPECRGVWLDRGELDKILDRAASEFGGGAATSDAQPVVPAAPAPAAGPIPAAAAGYGAVPPYQGPRGGRDHDRSRPDDRGYDRSRDDDGYRDRDRDDRERSSYDGGYNPYGGKRKKKENWLSELFD